MKTVCKKCLLREMAEADKNMIEKYKAAIKAADRAPEACYESRLSVCKACRRRQSTPPALIKNGRLYAVFPV